MTTKKNKQNYVKPSVMVVELMEPATLLLEASQVDGNSGGNNNVTMDVEYTDNNDWNDFVTP